MTHDELLAKLWVLPADVTEVQHGAKAVQALRAVVELHRVSNVGLFCDGCARFVEPHPCPTLRVIAKELG